MCFGVWGLGIYCTLYTFWIGAGELFWREWEAGLGGESNPLHIGIR
jgi:hypothetical protein